MKKAISLFALLLLGVPPPCTFAQADGSVKWTYTTGNTVDGSSPALGADGTIYVGSWDRKLHAVNPDGTPRWTYDTGSFIESSPALATDGTLYVGSRDNKLHAVNPDGTPRWTYTTGGTIDSSPALGADGTIYVGSSDDKLHAVNPDGTPRWTYETNGDVDSSPALGADGTIYVGSWDRKLHAVNPDGTPRWTYDTGSIIECSSPALGADGTVYIGSWDDRLHAVNPDGTRLWTYTTGGDVDSSPALGADGIIYVGSSDNKLHAVNPDGTPRWTYDTGGNVDSSPALGADGTIYVGSWDHKLHAVNPDGTPRWTYDTGSFIDESSPALGPDGTVYIGSWNHRLHAIHSASNGLASSPWPKFHNNNQNTGAARASIVLAVTDPVEFAFFTAGGSIQQTFQVNNATNQSITVRSCDWDHPAFSTTTRLPVTVPAGSTTPLTAIIYPDRTGFYESAFHLTYESEGQTRTTFGQHSLGLFLDDDSEQAYTAHRALEAFQLSQAADPASAATTNNRGVLYRLLGETETAEQLLMRALSASLNADHGYAGIKMNLGVVKSDQGRPVDAETFYGETLEDVASDESGSVMAPQVYYNRAWEAFNQGNPAAALTEINRTIAHGKANTFLLAKAYVLRGVLRYNQGDAETAYADFEQAIRLDPEGPIGRMAQENIQTTTSVEPVDFEGSLPEQFVLLPNYPNPFNPSTQIRFGVPHGDEVDLVVYNALGQRIRAIFSGYLHAGWYDVKWDGTNEAGTPVASGVYLLQMKAGRFESNHKMTVLR